MIWEGIRKLSSDSGSLRWGAERPLAQRPWMTRELVLHMDGQADGQLERVKMLPTHCNPRQCRLVPGAEDDAFLAWALSVLVCNSSVTINGLISRSNTLRDSRSQ